MTIKELSEFFGKHPDTVRAAAKKLGYESENGVTRQFNKEEVEKISLSIWEKVPTAVQEAIKITFGKPQGQPSEISKADDRLDRLENMMEKMLLTVAQILPVLAQNSQPKAALPAPITQEYFSILAYCRNNGLSITTDTAKTIGMECRKRSIRLSKEIHQVPDERWGKVNSYHVDVLLAVFKEWKHA